jgi:DNA helicase-2/ATP-dependent DNA helicase PcrA
MGKRRKSTVATQFKARDSVQHAKFGVGTVIESNIVGGEEEVAVAFPGIGIKRLLVSMAGLKKL